jgi:hypothetical protein
MSPLTIPESGMNFGPYSEDECFHVEKSAVYSGIQSNIKIAEFLWATERRGGAKVFIVEAKSSSPRPETQPNFDTFIAEIRHKMVNTLMLFLGMRVGRHGMASEELPERLRNIDLAGAGFVFVLVIRAHRLEWLVPLQDALEAELHATARTFGLKPPFVIAMNEDMARQHGLIRAAEEQPN